MAGPFGLLGSGGSPGLLGGGFWDQMQQNRQQTLGRAPGGVPFAQNPVVTALGAALVGGKNMAGKYDFSNLGPAMGARTAMQGQIQAKQEAEAKRKELQQDVSKAMLIKSGRAPPDPELQARLAANNPDLYFKLFPDATGAKPVVVGNQSRLVDPTTGETIVDAAPEPSYRQPSFMEAGSRGLPLDRRQEYQIRSDNDKIEKIGGGGVTINTGDDVRTKALVESYQKVAEDAPAADQLLQSTKRLSQLLATAETGTSAALTDFVRRNTGVEIGDDAGAIQAISSLIDYMTPRMRVPGSGATSDVEMASFKNSLPTLLGTPEGNATITQTVGGLAQRRADQAAIAQQYLMGNITAQEAYDRVQALPDPFDAFKSWQKQAGALPKGGDWTDLGDDVRIRALP